MDDKPEVKVFGNGVTGLAKRYMQSRELNPENNNKQKENIEMGKLMSLNELLGVAVTQTKEDVDQALAHQVQSQKAKPEVVKEVAAVQPKPLEVSAAPALSWDDLVKEAPTFQPVPKDESNAPALEWKDLAVGLDLVAEVSFDGETDLPLPDEDVTALIELSVPGGTTIQVVVNGIVFLPSDYAVS